MKIFGLLSIFRIEFEYLIKQKLMFAFCYPKMQWAWLVHDLHQTLWVRIFKNGFRYLEKVPSSDNYLGD